MCAYMDGMYFPSSSLLIRSWVVSTGGSGRSGLSIQRSLAMILARYPTAKTVSILDTTGTAQ